MFDKRQSSSLSGIFDERLILSLTTSNFWHGDDLEYQQTWLTGLLNWHQRVYLYLHSALQYGATDTLEEIQQEV
jgi:hypothetical protein